MCPLISVHHRERATVSKQTEKPASWLPGFVMIVGLLAPSAVRAQGDFNLPPAGILTNYDRVPIGQREGLEAGAYVARTDDAAAPWFNPAGLALSEKSGLNGSSNAYEVTSVTLEGIGTAKGSTRFSPTGTYFGGVLGAPIIKNPKLRLGFYYAKPQSWSPSVLDGALQVPNDGGTETFSYSTSTGFSTIIPGFGAGYRAGDRFRLGLNLGYAITNINQVQSVSDRLILPGGATTGLRSFVTDGNTTQLLFGGGVQYDLSPKLAVGALVVSPGLRLGGSSKIEFQNSVFTGAGSREVTFRDEDATFRYKIPLRITAGAAARLGQFELEADLKFHAKESSYELLTSDSLANVLVTDVNGIPTLSTLAFAPVVEEARAVYNLAFGTHYAVSKAFRIHAGFFTDDSPIENSAATIFRSVDLKGASAGVSFTGAHLSGSLGVAGSWGTTDERQVGPSIGGIQTSTTVKVRTFNLMYAISYAF
jgi:hypothetical protein